MYQFTFEPVIEPLVIRPFNKSQRWNKNKKSPRSNGPSPIVSKLKEIGTVLLLMVVGMGVEAIGYSLTPRPRYGFVPPLAPTS